MTRRDIRVITKEDDESVIHLPSNSDSLFDQVKDKVANTDWVSSVSIGFVTVAALAMQHQRTVKVA
jgi:hypothetical protein